MKRHIEIFGDAPDNPDMNGTMTFDPTSNFIKKIEATRVRGGGGTFGATNMAFSESDASTKSKDSFALSDDVYDRQQKKHRQDDGNRHAPKKRKIVQPARYSPTHVDEMDDDDEEEQAERKKKKYKDKDVQKELERGFKGKAMSNWMKLTGQEILEDEDERRYLQEMHKKLENIRDEFGNDVDFINHPENNNRVVRENVCKICEYTAIDPYNTSIHNAFTALMLTDLRMIGNIQSIQLMQNCANAFNECQRISRKNNNDSGTFFVTVSDVQRHLLNCSIANPLRVLESQIRMCTEIMNKGQSFLFGDIGDEGDPYWDQKKTMMIMFVMRYQKDVSKEFWLTKLRITQMLETGDLSCLTAKNNKYSASGNSGRHVDVNGSKNKNGNKTLT